MEATPIYLFDFDSTLVTLESLNELATVALADQPDRAAILSQIKDISEAGTTGEVEFGESLRQRLMLFHANRRQVQQVAEKLKNNISPSVWAYRDWFRANNNRVYVVSGGFRDFVAPVAVDSLGLLPDHVFANDFVYNESGDITGFNEQNPLAQPNGKANQVAALNLLAPKIVIGDGGTDYAIKAQGQAEAFYVFTETVRRAELVALANKELASFDPARLAL